MSDKQVSRLIRYAMPVGFGIAVIGLLVPLPIKGRMGAAIGDLAHAPLFAALTLLSLVIVQKVWPLSFRAVKFWARVIVIAAAIFGLGVAMEFAQSMTGRSRSMHDAIANGLGVLAATLWFVAGWITPRSLGRRALQVTGLGLVLFSWWRPFLMIQDCYRVESQFPLIASFEHPIELQRWYFDDCHGELTKSNVTDGQHAMRWFPDDAPNPSITLLEVVRDWSNVASLELDITLVDVPAERTVDETGQPRRWDLIVKVIDEDHGDYHDDVSKHLISLSLGETKHVVFAREAILRGPDDRELDLTRIKMVSLLIDRPGPGVSLDVDHIHARLRRSDESLVLSHDWTTNQSFAKERNKHQSF